MSPDVLILGAGPAGLMAAEAASATASATGAAVLVLDAMPSPARKFLMAGKSGLNVTKSEPPDRFAAAYGPMPPALAAALAAFGPAEVVAWMEGLGQRAVTGSTGRVFPETWKASPLLRAWLARLAGRGVTWRMRHRFVGWDEAGAARVATPEGEVRLTPRATVLAFGGASWRRLGSDGAWAPLLAPDVAPFAPANAALRVDWSPHMARWFGAPVKAVAWHAGGRVSRGEAVVTAKGLEGGGLYPLTPALRDGARLTLDLMPDLTDEALRGRLAGRGKATWAEHLRRRIGLDGVRAALLMEWGRPLPADPVPLLKALPVRHAGLAPLDEAISTAGGLRFDALTDDLELRARPGTFAAGEMLDWEAPTGGYLLTASLATGRLAGVAAARHARGLRAVE